MIEKVYKRKLIEELIKFLDSSEIIVIHGARQVGKTFLMKYIVQEFVKENHFYMDLEILEFLDLCEKGPEKVYQYLLERGLNKNKKMFLLIDEIQYLTNPSNFLKVFHDHFSNIKLIVSGSSSFEIRKRFKESLVGRTVNFTLHPLDFEEFLTFKNKTYAISGNNAEKTNKELLYLFEQYVFFGGYPKIVLEDSEEKKKIYLSQIIDTYVRKDIRDIGGIRDITSFNNLLEILASQSAGLLNVREISRTLGMNNETVKKWLFLLEATYILKIVKPFHKNVRSEITKSPKIFFIDTGLMHLLHLKSFPKTALGNSFETSFFSELLKNKHDINFWRTANKQEIDFVLKRPHKIVAIETKLNFQKNKKTALRFFKEEYNAEIFTVSIYGERDSKDKKYPWEMLKWLEKNTE